MVSGNTACHEKALGCLGQLRISTPEIEYGEA